MTTALHRRRKAAKAAKARSSTPQHRVTVAREVLVATKDTTRVRLLCRALGWEEEPLLEALTEK